MNATLQQIRSAFDRPSEQAPNAIERLAAQSLPLPTAYRLKRIIEAAEKEYQRTEELRTELVKRLGQQIGGEAERWQVPAEKMMDFAREYTELLAESVTLPGCDALSIEQLERATISTADLFLLSWLIQEPEAEPKAEQVTQIKRKAKAA
jgi:hypothetical protein